MSDSDVETDFDQLTDWVVAEMTRVSGDSAGERKVLEETVRRYADVRRKVDPEEPWSYVTHFLNADGVAYEKSRTPAFARIEKASASDRKRWCDVAGEIAMELEAASLA